jgi:hypothetical protein
MQIENIKLNLDRSVNTVTKLLNGLLGSIPDEVRYSTYLHNVETGSGTQPASYPTLAGTYTRG